MTKAKKPKPTKDKAQEEAANRVRLDGAEGNNIRNWRIFRGIEKQRDLADMTKAHDPKGKGLDRVSVCRLETGELRYNEDHLTLLAKTLTVSVRDLIGTNPFDAGDVFAVYAGLSAADKRKFAKQIAKFQQPKPR